MRSIGMVTRLSRAFGVAAALSLAGPAPAAWSAAEAGVLAHIQARGHLICGVGEGPRGYSTLSGDGVWSGISTDFCRALAAAVLGNRDAVKFRPVTKGERFAPLQSGDIDVLSRNIAITSSHDAGQGVHFPGVLVFDGLGFMVRRSQGVASALELSGARICVLAESADAERIGDYFGALRMPFEVSRLDKWQDAAMTYFNKGCQVLAADVSTLALARQDFPDPGAHIILPETAGKQPVGPAVREGDEEWFGIVRWTLYALIAAEELGITSSNVEAMKAPTTVEARRFLGIDADVGGRLGLPPNWTLQVIKQVGNYGEMFERNLGLKSPLKLERRLNNLAGNGGLHYAPSFR